MTDILIIFNYCLGCVLGNAIFVVFHYYFTSPRGSGKSVSEKNAEFWSDRYYRNHCYAVVISWTLICLIVLVLALR